MNSAGDYNPLIPIFNLSQADEKSCQEAADAASNHLNEKVEQIGDQIFAKIGNEQDKILTRTCRVLSQLANHITDKNLIIQIAEECLGRIDPLLTWTSAKSGNEQIALAALLVQEGKYEEVLKEWSNLELNINERLALCKLFVSRGEIAAEWLVVYIQSLGLGEAAVNDRLELYKLIALQGENAAVGLAVNVENLELEGVETNQILELYKLVLTKGGETATSWLATDYRELGLHGAEINQLLELYKLIVSLGGESAASWLAGTNYRKLGLQGAEVNQLLELYKLILTKGGETAASWLAIDHRELGLAGAEVNQLLELYKLIISQADGNIVRDLAWNFEKLGLERAEVNQLSELCDMIASKGKMGILELNFKRSGLEKVINLNILNYRELTERLPQEIRDQGIYISHAAIKPLQMIANLFLDKTPLPGQMTFGPDHEIDIDKGLYGGFSFEIAPYLARTISLMSPTLRKNLASVMDPDKAKAMEELLMTFNNQLIEEGNFDAVWQEAFVAGYSTTEDNVHLTILAHAIAERVSELEKGQSVLIPTSSLSHAMPLEVERQLDGYLTVHIYNTGLGIDLFHSEMKGQDKFLTYHSLKNVNRALLENPGQWLEFLTNHLKQKNDTQTGLKSSTDPKEINELLLQGVASFYTQVFTLCDKPEENHLKAPSRNKHPLEYQSVQKKGSCAYLSQMAILRRKVMHHPFFADNSEEGYAAYKLIKGLVAHEFKSLLDPALATIDETCAQIQELFFRKLEMHTAELKLGNALANSEILRKEIEAIHQELVRFVQKKEAKKEKIPLKARFFLRLLENYHEDLAHNTSPSTLILFKNFKNFANFAAFNGMFEDVNTPDCLVKNLVRIRRERLIDKEEHPRE